MSNDLMIQEYSAEELALLDSLDMRVGGEENLEKGDVGMPPRLRISQPNRPIEMSGEAVEAGRIVNTLTGEMFESLEIVPIVFLPRTRVMWPLKYGADNAPMCVSDDGNFPSSDRDVSDPQSGPCNICQMAQFVNGDKPRCAMQRNFLVWLVNEQEAAILTMQSTAIKQARHLTSLAKMYGIRKSIIVDSVLVKDSRGSWYIPVFSAGKKLAIRDIVQIAEAKSDLLNLVISADVDDAPNDGHVVEEDDVPF